MYDPDMLVLVNWHKLKKDFNVNFSLKTNQTSKIACRIFFLSISRNPFLVFCFCSCNICPLKIWQQSTISHLFETLVREGVNFATDRQSKVILKRVNSWKNLAVS